MKPKLLVILMAGGSAAGKSTTSKAYAIGSPDERHAMLPVQTRKGEELQKVNWTLYDNYALTGNHHSGSDANKGPGAIRVSFNQCLPLRDVIIVDGKINSPQWVEMVNDVADDYTVKLVTLYFNLTAETLLGRLAARRGVDKESIRESMHQKCVEATGRADLLVTNTHKLAKVDYEIVEIYDDDSTSTIVDILCDIECEFFGDCE